MNQKSHTDRTKQQVATGDGSSTMTSRYLENILLAPGLVDLIGEGKMVDGSVKSASDFSYSAPKYAGERYRIVGDAGGKALGAKVSIKLLIGHQRLSTHSFRLASTWL